MLGQAHSLCESQSVDVDPISDESIDEPDSNQEEGYVCWNTATNIQASLE